MIHMITASHLREILRMEDVSVLYLDFSEVLQGEQGQRALENSNRSVSD